MKRREERKMFCENCGNQISDKDMYCACCGAKINKNYAGLSQEQNHVTPEDDYDDVNYIIDYVYRYCSFAGGTYKPRSHELFMRDDMGEKK